MVVYEAVEKGLQNTSKYTRDWSVVVTNKFNGPLHQGPNVIQQN